MTDITINDLTLTTLEGTGVFDVLMRATKTHLEAEFNKNRIKGPEYSTVYLGSLESVMRTSLEFLLQRQKISLEAQLMEQQVLVAQAEVEKANAQVELTKQQVLQSKVELEILQLNKAKIPAEIAHLNAQTALLGQQVLVAQAEVEKANAQVDLVKQQVLQSKGELEILQLSKGKIPAEIAHLQAQTALLGQQKLNAVIEGEVLTGQVCKLKAEYDLLMLQKDRTTAETSLLTQKIATERAQTTEIGVDTNSILGRQKNLYLAQTEGFARDAEQKAAKLMADIWNVQRTTDEGIKPTVEAANTDAFIGRAIKKMLSGVGA